MESKEPKAESLTLLAEMLRESERILDHQVKALEELDDKSEQMLGLGVALLGGGVAFGVLVTTSNALAVNSTFIGLLASAGLLNVAALAFFVGSYIGFVRHTEVHVGPSLAWIRDKSNEASWSLMDHYLSVLFDIPSYYDWNNRKSVAAARRRQVGVYVLLVAVALYGIAFLFILGNHIG